MPQNGIGKNVQKREAVFRKSDRVEPLPVMLRPVEHFTGCADLGHYLLVMFCLGTDSICLAANGLFNYQKLPN